MKHNELGSIAKFPDYAKPAGSGSGLYVVARSESTRRASGETEQHTSCDDYYIAECEIDIGRDTRGGVQVMGWLRSLLHSKIDERTMTREEIIAAEVSEINEIVSDFERKVKENGSIRRHNRGK